MHKNAPWTTYNVAVVREGDAAPIRVATNGTRVRIRCTDLRFDPPIEMDAMDFQKIMAAASLIGLEACGDVMMERVALGPNAIRFASLCKTSQYLIRPELNRAWAERVLSIAGGITNDVVGMNDSCRMYCCFTKSGDVVYVDYDVVESA